MPTNFSPDSRLSWDEYYMSLAMVTALRSPDPSTKVGAVIVASDNTVVSMGYNAFPRGFEGTPEQYNDREFKYATVVHAEANAIYNAGRKGVPLDGCSIYLPWTPCAECVKAIVQSGIARVYTLPAPERADWKETFAHGDRVLAECGVEVVVLKDFVNLLNLPVIRSGACS